jgi:hypothetical protein
VRAATTEQELAAYERGREAARRAVEREPRNAQAHFWYATNTGRWGQTRGVLRSLFLLPELRREIDTVLELDPDLVGVYLLAGSVDYEVPGMFGGDLARSEARLRRSARSPAALTQSAWWPQRDSNGPTRPEAAAPTHTGRRPGKSPRCGRPRGDGAQRHRQQAAGRAQGAGPGGPPRSPHPSRSVPSWPGTRASGSRGSGPAVLRYLTMP